MRGERNQLGNPRIERTARERQEIHRIQCAIVRSDVGKVSCARARQKNGAVRREVLRRIGHFIEEIKEELFLLSQTGTAFTESWQREGTADIETILMLKQLRFRQSTHVIEEGVGIKLVVAVEVIDLAMIAAATAWRREFDLGDAETLIWSRICVVT